MNSPAFRLSCKDVLCYNCLVDTKIDMRTALQLLGLRGRDSYLDPQILAAYEGLAAEPIEEGFSQRASDGRMLLLEEVFQVEMHPHTINRHKQRHYSACWSVHYL